jgi:DNA-binding YbaB/EbfC family protein
MAGLPDSCRRWIIPDRKPSSNSSANLTISPLTTSPATAEPPMKDLMKMMKQVQDIQGRMQQMQEELAALQVEGQSGGGLVKVTLNGKMEARAVKLDPSLLKPEDTEMLEDLILAAFQDAKGKVETVLQSKMQEVTGGLPLPPGLKLF